MSSAGVKFVVNWDLTGASSPQAEHTVYKGFSDVKEKPPPQNGDFRAHSELSAGAP